MKRLILILIIVPHLLFSDTVSETISSLIEELGAEYTALKADTPFYSKQTISIIEITNKSKDAADNYVGEAIEELLINTITNSLVFLYIDRQTLDSAVEEIKLSLSGITDERDKVEIGNIRGVKLLLNGSITEENGNFIINLRLIEIETTEIILTLSKSIPKDKMIEIGRQIAYEYVTANGIGTSFYITPVKQLIIPQSEMVVVGDDKIHGGSAGGRLTYRLGQNWKLCLNFNSEYHDVYHSNDPVSDMINLTAFDEVFTEFDILGVWNNNGTLDSISDGTYLSETEIKTYVENYPNFYSLSQISNTLSITLAYVYSFNQKINISGGLGPHINMLRLKQSYDNVPILINQGISFKRYEIIMDYIGLGATAAFDFEFFVLPRIALNLGCTYIFSVMLPPSEVDAKSPTTGEYYYTTNNFAIESFGLNPFMMPNGQTVSEGLFPSNYFKIYLGFSAYF